MPGATDEIKMDVQTYETIVRDIADQGKEIIEDNAAVEVPDPYAAGNDVVPDYQAYDERLVNVLLDLKTEVAQLVVLMTDIKDEYIKVDEDADKSLTREDDGKAQGKDSDN